MIGADQQGAPPRSYSRANFDSFLHTFETVRALGRPVVMGTFVDSGKTLQDGNVKWTIKPCTNPDEPGRQWRLTKLSEFAECLRLYPDAEWIAVVVGEALGGGYYASVDEDPRNNGQRHPPLDPKGYFYYNTKSGGKRIPYFAQTARPEDVPHSISVDHVDVLLHEHLDILPPSKTPAGDLYSVPFTGARPLLTAPSDYLALSAIASRPEDRWLPEGFLERWKRPVHAAQAATRLQAPRAPTADLQELLARVWEGPNGHLYRYVYEQEIAPHHHLQGADGHHTYLAFCSQLYFAGATGDQVRELMGFSPESWQRSGESQWRHLVNVGAYQYSHARLLSSSIYFRRAEDAVGRIHFPASELQKSLEQLAVDRIRQWFSKPNAHTQGGPVPLFLADLLEDALASDFRWEHDEGRWLVFDGKIWAPDPGERVVWMAEQVLLEIEQQAAVLYPHIDRWRDDWRRQDVQEAANQGYTGKTNTTSPGRSYADPWDDTDSDEQSHITPPPPSPIPGVTDADWYGVVRGVRLLAAFRIKQSNKRALYDAVELFRHRPGINIGSESLNVDRWALPCRESIVDLRTGTTRPYTPNEMWTWQCAYQPKEGPCPKFLEFMRLFSTHDGEPNEAIMDFDRRVGYYALTGDTSAKKIYNYWGPGSNGKTTFVNILFHILPRQVAIRADSSTFVVNQNDRIPTDLARMRGARLVVAPEPTRKKEVNMELLNALSGGDMVSARFMRQNDFSFFFQGKIFFYGSSKMRIDDQSQGTWDRMVFRKCEYRFPLPEEEGNIPDFADYVTREEGDQILQWFLDARTSYDERRLRAPDEVKQSTEEFRQESDWLGSFIRECIVAVDDAGVTTPGRDVYQAFRAWAADGGETKLSAMGAIRFNRALSERGFVRTRTTGIKVAWRGVKLSPRGEELYRAAPTFTSSQDREAEEGYRGSGRTR